MRAPHLNAIPKKESYSSQKKNHLFHLSSGFRSAYFQASKLCFSFLHILSILALRQKNFQEMSFSKSFSPRSSYVFQRNENSKAQFPVMKWYQSCLLLLQSTLPFPSHLKSRIEPMGLYDLLQI